ncbi:hypothetical protein DPMN_126367 [Dreissena polymorpha]|uniref:Uncharacterized protein n=1 Tax=Dreissena polymorpha TaxID=45954 RepID=A0A9D4GWX5_DREPO|nr:hypothetical protein DPMN_126367 [Dreissena polymorpha]
MPKDLGGEVAQGVNPVTGHTPTKKGNLKLCENIPLSASSVNTTKSYYTSSLMD